MVTAMCAEDNMQQRNIPLDIYTKNFNKIPVSVIFKVNENIWFFGSDNKIFKDPKLILAQAN